MVFNWPALESEERRDFRRVPSKGRGDDFSPDGVTFLETLPSPAAFSERGGTVSRGNAFRT
jgi:hypothetical protein